MNWRLGVVGSPIIHSLSPRLHEAGLELAGLDGSSRGVELARGDAQSLRALLGNEFDALSVTSPLKHVAFECADEVSEVALRTGSVNSLLMRDGIVYGASTDGQGFVDALSQRFSLVLAGAHVVVMGAGGAASAIVDALVHLEVATVIVHARSEERAQLLAQRYDNVFTNSGADRPVDLCVNTVPTGGRTLGDAIFPGVNQGSVAVDIAYEPRMTPWRQLYEDAGCRTMNGLAMLAFQAALQMRWWWGVNLEGTTLLEALN